MKIANWTLFVLCIMLSFGLMYLFVLSSKRILDPDEKISIVFINGEQAKVESAARQILESEFNKTITYLGLIISFFGISLTLFLIFVGFLTFGKLREISEIMDKAEKFPNSLLQTYYKNQIPTAINHLFEENYLLRAVSIKNLTQNPELSTEHFGVLKEAVQSELKRTNNPHYHDNVSNLLSAILGIDFERGVEFLFELVESGQPNDRIYPLFLFICGIKEDRFKVRIRNLLSISDFPASYLALQLLSTRSMDQETYEYIFRHCKEETITSIILNAKNYGFVPNIENCKDRLLQNPNLRSSELVFFLNKNFVSDFFGDKKIALAIEAIPHYTNDEDVHSFLNFALNNSLDDSQKIENIFRSAQEQNVSEKIIVRIYHSYKKRNFPVVADIAKKTFPGIDFNGA